MTDFIMINDVRISYPHLFVPRPSDNGPPKYSANFIVPMDHPQLPELQAAIKATRDAKLPGIPLAADDLCLKDKGEKSAIPGTLTLIASNRDMPILLAADGRTRITQAGASPVYPGCRVRVKIRLWALAKATMPNAKTNRIVADLIALQFTGNDEPLSDAYVSEEEAAEGFDAVELPPLPGGESPPVAPAVDAAADWLK